MLVYENLRQARKRKGMTQRELGEAAGVSAAIIGLYEKGLRSPRPATLQRIAQVLDVDADYLGASEDPDPEENNNYKMQLDSMFKLMNLLQTPNGEQKFSNSYARLNLALTELTRALKEREKLDDGEISREDELTSLRRIELFAKSCCGCFADLQAAFPEGYSSIKDSSVAWQKEKKAFDSLLTEYCKMNINGRKIAMNMMTALAATPAYQKTAGQDALEGFSWKTVSYYLKETRENKQLSLQQVGDKSGLGESFIQDVENGFRTPNAKELCSLSKTLDIRLTEFLPFSEEDAKNMNEDYDKMEKEFQQDGWTKEMKSMVSDAIMQIFEGKVELLLIKINTRGIRSKL